MATSIIPEDQTATGCQPIKTADWILDLGPEGGDGGGELVAAGTPEDVAKSERSWTGRFLKETFERQEARRVARAKKRIAEASA